MKIKLKFLKGIKTWRVIGWALAHGFFVRFVTKKNPIYMFYPDSNRILLWEKNNIIKKAVIFQIGKIK